MLTRAQEPFNDRICQQFRQTHETPESQLSSWSSLTGDNSLSDLYCDDEFKLSLEFDPNMQLFTTIEEEVEQEQEIQFPYLQRGPEGKNYVVYIYQLVIQYFRSIPLHVSKDWM